LIYLTEEEINVYCNIPGVDMNIVKYASILIESYLGDISEKQYTDTIALNRKNKGKLKSIKNNIPLVSIDEVKAITRTPLGIQEETLAPTDIEVNECGYFEYFQSNTFSMQLFNSTVSKLQIKYTVGYNGPPEDLKRACAMIAMGAKKRGFDELKSISDIDVKLEFANGSLITKDVLLILSRYKGV
jgi:hypothetical protein